MVGRARDQHEAITSGDDHARRPGKAGDAVLAIHEQLALRIVEGVDDHQRVALGRDAEQMVDDGRRAAGRRFGRDPVEPVECRHIIGGPVDRDVGGVAVGDGGAQKVVGRVGRVGADQGGDALRGFRDQRHPDRTGIERGQRLVAADAADLQRLLAAAADVQQGIADRDVGDVLDHQQIVTRILNIIRAEAEAHHRDQRIGWRRRKPGGVDLVLDGALIDQSIDVGAAKDTVDRRRLGRAGDVRIVAAGSDEMLGRDHGRRLAAITGHVLKIVVGIAVCIECSAVGQLGVAADQESAAAARGCRSATGPARSADLRGAAVEIGGEERDRAAGPAGAVAARLARRACAAGPAGPAGIRATPGPASRATLRRSRYRPTARACNAPVAIGEESVTACRCANCEAPGRHDLERAAAAAASATHAARAAILAGLTAGAAAAANIVVDKTEIGRVVAALTAAAAAAATAGPTAAATATAAAAHAARNLRTADVVGTADTIVTGMTVIAIMSRTAVVTGAAPNPVPAGVDVIGTIDAGSPCAAAAAETIAPSGTGAAIASVTGANVVDAGAGAAAKAARPARSAGTTGAAPSAAAAKAVPSAAATATTAAAAVARTASAAATTVIRALAVGSTLTRSAAIRREKRSIIARIGEIRRFTAVASTGAVEAAAPRGAGRTVPAAAAAAGAGGRAVGREVEGIVDTDLYIVADLE